MKESGNHLKGREPTEGEVDRFICAVDAENARRRENRQSSEARRNAERQALIIAEALAGQNQPSAKVCGAAPALVEPIKVDAWGEAILTAERQYRHEHCATPGHVAVWLRLQNTPPPGYGIEWDKRNKALRMDGAALLTREAFNKRWSRMAAKGR